MSAPVIVVAWPKDPAVRGMACPRGHAATATRLSKCWDDASRVSDQRLAAAATLWKILAGPFSRYNAPAMHSFDERTDPPR